MRIIQRSELDELTSRAAASARRRAHLNVHADASDPVQRFFVAAQSDSYFRPHRHAVKSELAMVLRGRFDVLRFDAQGILLARDGAGEGASGIGWEVPVQTWHTLVPLSDGSVFLEVKAGPYDAATAAEFAPWAPAESDRSAAAFLERLRTLRVGERASAA